LVAETATILCHLSAVRPLRDSPARSMGSSRAASWLNLGWTSLQSADE
jgi:hypothetical protein